VAINTVFGNFLAAFGEFSALFRLMAGQAARRECRGIALGLVDVVAGVASESVARQEAATLAKQLDLIPVNIDGLLGGDVRNVNVVAQIVSGKKRQGRCDGHAVAGVAESADINAAVAGEVCGIHNRFRRSRCKLRGFAVQRDMLLSGPVALFAKDPQDQAVFAMAVYRCRHPFEIAGVALETTRNDVLVKVRRAVRIAWAVDPGICLHPVRDRQLKELIALPEKITLTFAGLAGDDVDSFGA
jgi:hypothetical protein